MTALIGYVRVSKADGSQVHDLQRDALAQAGIEAGNIYEDAASGKKEDRPGLAACLKALRGGDTLVFGIFAALAEFERALIIERTKAGLEAARARGRNESWRVMRRTRNNAPDALSLC